MNVNKFEINLIKEWRRTCSCSECPFLNTSVCANVRKQNKNQKKPNIFMRFNLHANLNVCFKFTFSRIFRKVKKYSIIFILLNKPFSFALYIYMLCIIWVHVKRSWFNYMYIAISCDSLETRRTSEKIIVHENKWAYHLLHDAFSTCLLN